MVTSMGLLKGSSRPNAFISAAALFTFILLVGTWHLLIKRVEDESLNSLPDPDDVSFTTGTQINKQPPSHGGKFSFLGAGHRKPAAPPPPPPPPPPPSSSPEYAAVVTETDPANVPNLAPIVLHFATVIGPDWPINFVTNENNYRNWTAPPAFQRLVDSKQILVKYLPPETTFPSHESVSVFLVDTWFWEQFQHYKRILMFQVDSIVCANSEHKLDDFVQYDLIGAPIKPGMGNGYNGGLSLRNPRMMLDIAADLQSRIRMEPNTSSEVDYEDQWFFKKVGEFGGKLAEPEVAGKFSVETDYYEKPLGYHQVQKFQKERADEINKYCPEVAMILKGSHWR